MKVGNQAQAIALCVVAVGAIAFLFLQVKGRMQRAASTSVAQNQPASTEPTNVPVGLPKTVYGDPFTHPALPRQEPPKPKKDPKLQPKSEIGGALSPVTIGSDGLIGEPGKVAALPAPTPPHGPEIALRAVVTDPERVAFVSLDGKEPVQMKAGQRIVADIYILAIEEGAIQIRFSKTTKTVSVGETLKT